MKKKQEQFDEDFLIGLLDDDSYEENEKPIKKKKEKKSKKNKEEPIIIKKIDEEEAKEIVRKKREKKDDIIAIDNIKEMSKNNKKKSSNIISNLFFIMIVLLLIMAISDIVIVSEFNKGPYFAIPLKTYDDGGSKEYFGLGYKVIKYKQIQGRRDTVLGTWNLNYNIEPTTVEAIDLAIEFNKNETKAYNKYNKQFIRVIGTLKDIDTYNNTIVVGYEDEDGKYTLDLKCNMATDYSYLENLNLGEEITIIGNVVKYKYKNEKSMSRLYLDNVFAEQ